MSAVVAQHAGVQGASRRVEPADVVGEQPLQQVPRAAALQVDGEHVRDVEHAGAAADAVVLLELRAVVQRHLPAAEVGEPRPCTHVLLVQRGVAQSGHAKNRYSR